MTLQGSDEQTRIGNKAVLNCAESLKVARAYANLLGEIPSSFSSVLRTLISDEAKGSLSNNGKFAIGRLLKSPALFVPLYYGGLTFRGDAIKENGGETPDALLKTFSPEDLSGLVATTYLYRRVRTLISDEVWSDLSAQVKPAAEIGGHVGVGIPKIGLTMGMFVGALPLLALGLFHRHAEKSYKVYRRHLRSKKVPMDLDVEMTTWGCTRFDIASVLLQIFGYGVGTANTFAQGLSCLTTEGQGLPDEVYRFKVATMWMKELSTEGREPQIKHRGDFYPTQQRMSVMLSAISGIAANGSKFNFLDKSKDDAAGKETSPPEVEVEPEKAETPLVE